MQSSNTEFKIQCVRHMHIGHCICVLVTITFQCMQELIFINMNTFTIAYTYITITQHAIT